MGRRSLLVIAGLVLATSAAPPSSACSMCKCGDPTFSALGTQVFVANKFRFTIDWTRFRKSAAEQPEDTPIGAETKATRSLANEKIINSGEETRMTLGFAYSFKDRLTALASVPIAKHRLSNADESLDSSGLADPELTAVVRVWRKASAVVAVKTPWGEDSAQENGERLDQHVQSGTGSTDWTVGGSIVHQTGNVTAVYGSLMHRFTGANRYGYEYGDAWLGNVGVQRRFNTRVSGSVEVNARDADQDRINDDGEIDPHSGGRVVYVSPRLLFNLGHEIVARIGVQLPVYERLDGVQNEKVNFQVGLTAVF